MANSDYQFVSTDTATVLTDLVQLYEKLAGTTLAPASPEKIFISWMAEVIVQVRELINWTANQNIPSRADGQNLDALAELFFQTERPAATFAQVTMRFYISEAINESLIIPSGTRCTDPDNLLVWETTEDAEIEAGETYVDVLAICQDAGETGNEWTPGQITECIDPFSYYLACENITESDGGSDEATDEEFAALLRQSEDAYTTAGSTGAYIYWAKQASTLIADAMAIQPIIEKVRTLTVYDHHAFVGGYDLQADTLTVSCDGRSLAEDLDYTVTFDDDLLTIELLDSGSAYDAETLDVSIEDILAGEVWIYALMKDGSLPSEEMKALILAACDADEVRPLTDKVSVHDAEMVSYDIDVTYYMSQNSEISAAEITAGIEDAVEEYKAWQCEKLGRDINPSKLISLLMATGCKRVEVNSPVFTELADGTDHKAPELAVVNSVTITNGGFEDD